MTDEADPANPAPSVMPVDEFRNRIAVAMADRRERRASMLEQADEMLIKAVEILDDAKDLWAGETDESHLLADRLEELAARMERLEVDMREKAAAELEEIASLAQRAQLHSRERDLVEQLLGLAESAIGSGREPDEDPEFKRLSRVRLIVEAERERVEELRRTD